MERVYLEAVLTIPQKVEETQRGFVFSRKKILDVVGATIKMRSAVGEAKTDPMACGSRAPLYVLLIRLGN